MSAASRRRAVAPGASGVGTSGFHDEQQRLAWWVSQDAVRQAIGAWAATARAGRVRPTLELIRAAVGVACALAECAAAAPLDPDTLPLQARVDVARGAGAARVALTRPVPYDPAQLSEMSGVGPREVERALEVLQQAGVVSRPHGDRGALVLSADCLAPAPAIGAIAWPAVRDRLTLVGAPVAAPCATLRALAERLGDGVVSHGGDVRPAIRVSVRDLELVTAFRRSTVSEAVAALVRARLLDVDTRAGHTGRFVIRPAAFGLPDAAPEVPETDAARALVGGTVAIETERARSALRGASPHASSHESSSTARAAGVPATPSGVGAAGVGAPVLVGTFAGTPIYAPPGTPMTVECDADGRWSCRVGPYLQLGPVANG